MRWIALAALLAACSTTPAAPMEDAHIPHDATIDAPRVLVNDAGTWVSCDCVWVCAADRDGCVTSDGQSCRDSTGMPCVAICEDDGFNMHGPVCQAGVPSCRVVSCWTPPTH